MTIYVYNRQIVLPGDLIATKDCNVLGSVYWEGNKAYATSIALIDIKDDKEVHVIPLAGSYKPKVGDIVIGYVSDVHITGWEIDIKAPYPAYLPLQEAVLKPVDITTIDLKSLLNIGDAILAKVIDFNTTREYPIALTIKEAKLGKIDSGLLIEIEAVKVPRVIGKKGSMVNLFKEELNCDVIVGQNGIIWIKCLNSEDETYVANLIKIIEQESHTTGLTERIRSMIRNYKKAKYES